VSSPRQLRQRGQGTGPVPLRPMICAEEQLLGQQIRQIQNAVNPEKLATVFAFPI